jgi:tetratricopeptide (TPR) repeat protein
MVAQAIDRYLSKRDVRKAEVMIARWLRSELSAADRAKALISRARVRLFSGRIDDALDDLSKARALNPDEVETPAAQELRGDCHFARFELASLGFADRQDTAQALEAYETILTRAPQYDNIGWVHYQRGRVLLTENRIEEAVACFHEALLSPSTIPALTAYCYERLGFAAFYEMRDPRRAVGFLNKAIATYPASEERRWLAQAHTLLSRVLREVGEQQASREAAESAVAIASIAEGKAGLADALLSAAETLSYVDSGERDVISYLQQFIQITRKPLGIDVTYSRVYEMLGDAYFKTGQHQSAVASYQNALQFNPYHPWEQSIYYRIARSCYQMGEYERAIQSIERLMQLAEADGQTIHDYRVFNVLGNAQYALRQYERASRAYANALELAPHNAEHLDRIRQYFLYAQQLSGAV